MNDSVLFVNSQKVGTCYLFWAGIYVHAQTHSEDGWRMESILVCILYVPTIYIESNDLTEPISQPARHLLNSL